MNRYLAERNVSHKDITVFIGGDGLLPARGGKGGHLILGALEGCAGLCVAERRGVLLVDVKQDIARVVLQLLGPGGVAAPEGDMPLVERIARGALVSTA